MWSMFFDEEEAKDLTASESLIMKAVWDSPGDISTMELQTRLKENYGKDYAITTIRTFLIRLSDKGFVKNYRAGRTAYVHPLKTEEEYMQQMLQKQRKFWYGDSASEFVCSVFQSTKGTKITKEELAELRRMLDDWDGNGD